VSPSRPIILLTARHRPRENVRTAERAVCNTAYYDAVETAGGLPIIAPHVSQPGSLDQLLALATGILLTGGYDLRGATFGQADHREADPMTERRQAFELAVARAAIDRRIPVLAICLGIQVLNVAAGGTLCQHVPDQFGTTVPHRAWGNRQAHTVALDPGSRIAELAGTTRLTVNSTHHQAVDCIALGFVAVGRSEADGVIEAIEARDRNWFAVGVQWHPEQLTDQAAHLALFRGLVEAADAWTGI